jgi:transcriptional regulator with GAF, ATPase, and Fis domain
MTEFPGSLPEVGVKPSRDTRPVEEQSTDGGLTTDQLVRYARDLSDLFQREKQARQELAQRRDDLELLIDVHTSMSRCLDVAPLVEALLEAIVSRLGAARVLVYLGDADGENGFAYIAGRTREPLNLPKAPGDIPPGHPLHTRLVDRNAIQVVAGPLDPELGQWVRGTYSASSVPDKVLCLPLPGRDGVLGFVAVDFDPEKLGAGDDRGPVLALLTRNAGIQLDNVTLYEQSRCELSVVKELYDTEQKKLIDTNQFGSIIGGSPRMKVVFNLLRTVSNVNVPVLVTGETGTGKDLVARALHYTGDRAEKPFVSVNCAAVPGELVESELFGHEKGAFTGAIQRRIGKVEMAEGGTLFLDEIAEMPANLQAKLLRFLQERTFERVGGTRSMRSDVRIVAATNRDVEAAIRDETLRMDLIYRLNTITVHLPPLRDRLDDIPLLVKHFVVQANERYGCAITDVNQQVYSALMQHTWPGNIRELKNVIDRAAILTGVGSITGDTVQLAAPAMGSLVPTSPTPPTVLPLNEIDDRSFTDLKREVVEQFEIAFIDRLLKESEGNVSQAARNAHIDKKNFIGKMRRYGIDRKGYLT